MSFVKDATGNYVVSGTITASEIIEQAKAIAWEQLNRLSESLNKPDCVKDFLSIELSGERNEVFGALFLDNKHRVIAFERMFTGTIDACSVHPRVIVQRGLELNAAALIVAHNHPSGDCTPSAADIDITQKLRDILDLVEIRLLDHFFIGKKMVSLAEKGCI